MGTGDCVKLGARPRVARTEGEQLDNTGLK